MRFVTRLTWAAERVIGAVTGGAAQVARAMRPLPPNTTITQLQRDNQSNWPLPDILGALDDHEDGDFSASAKLAAAFGRDDRIGACRGTRIRALVGKNGAKFSVEASDDGDQRRSGTICGRVKKLYFQCFTEDVVSRILGDAIDLGVSISRVHWVWVDEAHEWRPKLEPYDMRWVRYDHWRKCYVAQVEQGEIEIRPNTGEWLIIEPGGERGWMSGAVRALAMAFYFRGLTWKDWARYCEKHGVPILAIEEPNAANDTTNKQTKETFFARLKRLGREGVLRLPRSTDGKTGYDAKILEPSTLSWPSFEAFLKRLDVCIAIFLLGQNLSTEVQGGSLAATVAQNRVRLDYLASDAEMLSTAFRAQVLMFWGRFNVEGWNDALAPWPKWDTAEPEDQKQKSTVLTNVTSSLATAKKNGLPIQERELLEQYSIPVYSRDEWQKLQDEAAKKAAEALKQQQQAAPKTDEKDDEESDAASRASRFAELEESIARLTEALATSQRDQREIIERVTRNEQTFESAIARVTQGTAAGLAR